MKQMTARLMALMISTTFLGACMSTTAIGAGDSWKEEVLLHDGQKMIVERVVERGGRHEIGQKPDYIRQSLSFTMPETKQKTIWEDKFSEDLGGSNFLPMVLDVRSGLAYLVASPLGCLSYNKWGRPNPPYVVFKYQGKDWQRIPLQELPLEITAPNLNISSPEDEVEKSGKRFITADMVMQMNQGFSQPQYKTILREALAIQPCPQYPSGPKPPIPTAPIGLQK